MVVSKSKNLNNTILKDGLSDRLQLEGGLIEFQTLVENTKVMMLVFQDDHICYANPITQVLTGYTKEELLVQTDLIEQLTFKSKPQISESDNGSTTYQQVELLTKNGQKCWLGCSIRLIKFAGKAAIFITAVNINQYKQAEQKIEQIVKQEQKLVSIVSHELRAPLNVISFSSQLLNRYSDRWKPAKIKEYLERLQRGVDTLSLLIDEWLILGKVEAGKLKFEPQPLDLEQFCRNLLSDLQLGECNPRQINLFIQGDNSLISLDSRLLQLIMTNFLENALKYSPNRQDVDLTLIYEPEQIIFTIKDRGIGIEQEDLNRLFEPFYRGNNVDNIPGHGLGLAVVKKLVELSGGQITVESQLGIGTEFVIAFPKPD